MYRNLSKYIKSATSSCNFTNKFQRSLSSTNKLSGIKSGLETKYEVGSAISGFRVTEVKSINELQLTAIRLEHAKTGAEYLHVAREDSNNVFCIGFRTTPMDSTGVPHILEHNVLCGSQSFPCRDPFFKMLNRSLSTFMNAMTGSDYTIYPFSTQNQVDYQNLMSIYLDAVFKPNLSEVDFLQEGWRLEHEDVGDKASPIVIKGVVFNEMKGVFADSQQLFMQKLQNGVLPSHTYGVVSGGDPLRIPELTWDQLKQFHAKHYHPSNSRIYSYGDFPLESHLSFIDEHYLSQYEKIKPNTSVPEEVRWTEPRATHIGCNADPMIPSTSQTSLAVSYLLTNIENDFENFVLAIIGELLISGPNSPFYKTLIEPELGTSLSPVAGYDGHTRSTTFTVGLQGMNSAHVDDVRSAIEKTFETVIEEGFSVERIESVLHSIELGLKHQTSNFGLGLVMNLTPLWNHGGNFIEALCINEKIHKLRTLLKQNPLFLQDKVKEYFQSNKHKFTLTMAPEDNFEQKIVEADRELQERKTKHLSSEERESIWNFGQLLKSKQDVKEDISCLPTLHISDIPRSVQHTPLSYVECGGVPLQLCIQPTNGVAYFSAVMNTQDLDKDLVNLVPLFCNILTSMGAGDLDFKAFNQRTELLTGGLHSQFHITNHPENQSHYEEGIHLSSYCLQKNFVPMLTLWSKVLNELRLDDISRFTTLVKMITTEKANSVVHSGHSYAMAIAAASTSYVSFKQENVSGLSYLQHLKELSDVTDLSPVLDKMKRLAAFLLNKKNLRVALNVSSEYSDENVRHTEAFLQSMDGSRSVDQSPLASIPASFHPTTQHTHHVFPFPVNYAAKSYTAIPFTHPDSAPLRVLARLMFQFLHREIREKGGAYGGGATAHPGGPFCFFSYRDPHTTRTLQTFDDAIEWILSGEFTPQDVAEAKLGVFQRVDSPVSPGAKGMRHFLSHVSDQMWETHRVNILDASSEDIIRVCRKHLKESTLGGTCLIGPQCQQLSDDPSWNTISH